MKRTTLLRCAAVPVLAAALLMGAMSAAQAATGGDGDDGKRPCPHACPPGRPGPPGPTLPTQIIRTPHTLVSGLNTGTSTCPAGTVITGGGYVTPLGGNNLTAQVYESFPSAENTWTVSFNNSASTTGSYTVYAVCIPVTPTV
ncbi:hypothetical protein ACFFV7_38795 [Nonomuraea spiralis]|uniref:Uncharacterized protein n=1 Tax=Nonomuraea spiralis TaxID=46182 RepID=A0ABV5IRQ9_9ACTN|nr:hypothetical protein [Nonomuraea spiralis]GGT46089.1 hypothetical protein GCM10010176_106570 [Nonomuraea spiralis]